MGRWQRRMTLIGLLALSCTRMPTAPRDMVDVHGTILDPSGEPVASLPVFFFTRDPAISDSSRFPLVGYTNHQGEYSVTMIAGLYELEIPGRGSWLGYRGLVKVSPKNDRIDFAFHGFRVTGRILDPAGSPITYGAVDATLDSPYPVTAKDYTYDGTYSLLLPAGTYTLQGRGTEYYSPFTPTTIPSVSIVSDTTLDVQLVGYPIEGTVLDMSAAPLEGAMVDAFPARTLTDALGRYRLYAPAGPHAMRCFPPDPSILPQLTVTTVAGPTTVDFDFFGLVRWTGKALRVDTAEPLPTCYVLASVVGPDNRDAWALATAGGDFTMNLEPRLSYVLEVFPDANFHRTPLYSGVFLAAADTTFDLRVAPPTPSP